MRILLVEDEALIALVAEATLTAAGHQVIGPYKTHRDALEAAAREKPDVAMVDINLAGQNEGVGIVRDLYTRCGVRSVFATGQPGIARANKNIAIGVLPKPYSEGDLVCAIPVLQAILEGRAPPPPTIPAGLEVFA